MNMKTHKHILLCRPQYENDLCDELRFRSIPFILHQTGYGYIELAQTNLPSQPLIFERQRILNTQLIPIHELAPIQPHRIEQILSSFQNDPMPWSFLLFTEEEAKSKISVQLDGIWKEIHRQACKLSSPFKSLERKSEKLINQKRGLILQLFLCQQGLYFGWQKVEELSSEFAGGVHRMKFDSNAPSRSFLKMEEALSLIEIEPKAGQIVVDLGAAPGGWSYSFAKRGCHVTAVDNGPLKIKGEYTGTIQHLRADGPSFQPASQYLPVDFLVADMLIPPNKALELLKKWMENLWCKNLIVNIKLPQQNPFQGLGRVIEYLEKQQKFKIKIRQIYHDRQEVTVFGQLK